MEIKQSQKKKILDTSKLVKKSNYNAKISEVENKIPSISGLVATSVLTAVENKIPNVGHLFKKLTITHKLMKLKRKLLIINMVIMLLLQTLKNYQQKILMQDQHKQI